MLRKPKILVVGSFVMDLIASTEKRPPTLAKQSSANLSVQPQAEKEPIRRYSAPVWVLR